MPDPNEFAPYRLNSIQLFVMEELKRAPNGTLSEDELKHRLQNAFGEEYNLHKHGGNMTALRKFGLAVHNEKKKTWSLPSLTLTSDKPKVGKDNRARVTDRGLKKTVRELAESQPIQKPQPNVTIVPANTYTIVTSRKSASGKVDLAFITPDENGNAKLVVVATPTKKPNQN